MKPTENTFSFSINAVREQAEPPNEKVEKLESPESFDLFDKFVRGAREREHATGSGQRVLRSPSQCGAKRTRFLASGSGFAALTNWFTPYVFTSVGY